MIGVLLGVDVFLPVRLTVVFRLRVSLHPVKAFARAMVHDLEKNLMNTFLDGTSANTTVSSAGASAGQVGKVSIQTS